MKTVSQTYFSLPFDKLIQKKIPALINLVLPDGFIVIDVDPSTLQPSYIIGREGDKVACASINYFWSNGPMLRFTIMNTDEGAEFLAVMKSFYHLDSSLILTI